MTDSADAEAHGRRVVEAVWRAESARIVGALTRHTGDFAWSEDLAQEALLAALKEWPRSGIPDNPGAWLLSVAKRRAIDGWRRRARMQERVPLLGADVLLQEAEDAVADLGDPDRIDDDVLRLVFVACHPILPPEARLALTLRTVGGLTSEEIARMLLMTVSAVQQRIVRAKRTLAAAGVPFEVPSRAERPERLAAVLQVIYLLFTEGYSPSTGEIVVRRDVAREAVRLARQLSALMPEDSEVFGLLGLMEFQSSRFAARVGSDGTPLTLEQQDRSRWDRSAIRRGSEAIERVEASARGYGYYGLQAAIAQCHALAADYALTDWTRIVLLYDALASIAPSPVVLLNRAVAVSMSGDVGNAAIQVEELAAELTGFRPFHAVRAELAERMGDRDRAVLEFRRAADLPGNDGDAIALRRRADELDGSR